ncbi:hypothetical protein F511_42810 [Dorcoceras hygrometricum]|uniref:Uncharacterized protein n=1 Tax=Dorcoceras hygrometricum TaxID=472368 RepID=A0A2Z7CAC5_9LAMI|nr:hypothetical protein F511_42810 [Dorcoceras hygrometricum]
MTFRHCIIDFEECSTFLNHPKIFPKVVLQNVDDPNVVARREEAGEVKRFNQSQEPVAVKIQQRSS